jgi:NAD(P)-dependent dehydrogenase (short-subunit alcohol dehydrogenase family)
VTLAGKSAIVTGASSGIDEGTLAAPTDVTNPAACAALMGRATERFGSLEVLVNNAGLEPYGSVADGDPEDWRTSLTSIHRFPKHNIGFSILITAARRRCDSFIGPEPPVLYQGH